MQLPDRQVKTSVDVLRLAAKNSVRSRLDSIGRRPYQPTFLEVVLAQAVPPVVEFVKVTKTFGKDVAVNDISFHIQPGEFFSLLGPSGCGKTTTLRLIAGFEEPDSNGGEVRLHGEVVNTKRPYERKLAMVFQNYALFPHLSVARNVAFGLEMQKTPKLEIAHRVQKALEMVQLEASVFAQRKPAQLSGGQRQRVALARALVLQPSILLLDEPLGALDLKLRKEMQLELKSLNKKLGMTFIYVTHDQEEALTMSDRIAVMSNARIAQIGSPAEIYEAPRTPFVAKFIGESNFFEGRCRAATNDGGFVVDGEGTSFVVPGHPALAVGQPVRIAVRPEWLNVFGPADAPKDDNVLAAKVRDVIYLGETLHLLVRINDKRDVTVAVRNSGQLNRPLPWRAGDDVVVGWKPLHCQVLEADT